MLVLIIAGAVSTILINKLFRRFNGIFNLVKFGFYWLSC